MGRVREQELFVVLLPWFTRARAGAYTCLLKLRLLQFQFAHIMAVIFNRSWLLYHNFTQAVLYNLHSGSAHSLHSGSAHSGSAL